MMKNTLVTRRMAVQVSILAVILLMGCAPRAMCQRVLLDNYYNNEWKKDAAGAMVRYHYVWSDTTNSGFSQLGKIIKDLGLAAASAIGVLLAVFIGISLVSKEVERRSIYSLPPWQIRMVEVARQCGASANFAGSGGAIIGTYHGDAMYHDLCAKMAAIGSRVIRPQTE